MCMAVYLGSDIELPTSKWDKNKPSFYAENAQEDDNVKKQFTKKNIYYLGSHEGCGCGFSYDDNEVNPEYSEEVKDNELRKDSVKHLVQYLKNALEKTTELELFICWEGEQGEKPNKRATITVEEILGTYWSLDTREFYKVIKK
ncbi:MAG: hypothetical protein KAS51_07225 [Candidatus Omnitrophica bacterium]|nr:hypothetical protein [Candidatus Omnitrophota bacterium]